jgi:dTDP-4-amino-4,6-dideoxygalactose transaminase
MTELHGALGVAQMSRLSDIVEARRENARTLTEGLRGLEGVVTPAEDAERRHVFHQYTIRVTGTARMSRDRLGAHLRANEIGCGVYYPRSVYDYACFRTDGRVGRPSTPNADRAAREVLSLPVHPRLSPADLSRIVEVVREALE